MTAGLTASQGAALAARKARACERLQIVREVAAEGGSRADAAGRSGMTVKGLNALLYRETRSTIWPPSGCGSPCPETATQLPPPVRVAAAPPSPASAGGGGVTPSRGEGGNVSSWAERHVARRDHARRFLAGRGLSPQRDQAEGASALPRWKVPGWARDFDDHDLIALAEHHGMEAARG